MDLGAEFDDFSPLPATRYYETLLDQRLLKTSEIEYAQRWRLLYHLMTQTGFTNYAGEWWHYDQGNWVWAAQTGRACLYGPIENL